MPDIVVSSPSLGGCMAGDVFWALIIILTTFITFLWMQTVKKSDPDKRSTTINYFELSGVPLPRSLPKFVLAKAKPRPYRPFRWPFHQTMSLAPLENDWWIELESTYHYRVNQRKELYAKHRDAILFCLPGAEAACRELMFMVVQFLRARYPAHFFFDPRSGIFRNDILGSTFDTNTVESPLHFLLDNVPEDFLIMLKDETTGFYHLKAAVSASAIGFSLKEKKGKPLHEIHDPVPDYAEKLKPSMDRFFDRMPVNKPIQRGSWSFEAGQPLYLMADDPAFALHKQMYPNLDISEVHLRVDWQTLRRLPESKAIVFHFKAFFTPVIQLKDEPYVPALISKVLRGAKENIKTYKGWSHLEHKLLPALDAYAEDQVAKGLVPEGWEVRTLDEHPFYPGWKSKWDWDSE